MKPLCTTCAKTYNIQLNPRKGRSSFATEEKSCHSWLHMYVMSMMHNPMLLWISHLYAKIHQSGNCKSGIPKSKDYLYTYELNRWQRSKSKKSLKPKNLIFNRTYVVHHFLGIDLNVSTMSVPYKKEQTCHTWSTKRKSGRLTIIPHIYTLWRVWGP